MKKSKPCAPSNMSKAFDKKNALRYALGGPVYRPAGEGAGNFVGGSNARWSGTFSGDDMDAINASIRKRGLSGQSFDVNNLPKSRPNDGMPIYGPTTKIPFETALGQMHNEAVPAAMNAEVAKTLAAQKPVSSPITAPGAAPATPAFSASKLRAVENAMAPPPAPAPAPAKPAGFDNLMLSADDAARNASVVGVAPPRLRQQDWGGEVWGMACGGHVPKYEQGGVAPMTDVLSRKKALLDDPETAGRAVLPAAPPPAPVPATPAAPTRMQGLRAGAGSLGTRLYGLINPAATVGADLSAPVVIKPDPTAPQGFANGGAPSKLRDLNAAPSFPVAPKQPDPTLSGAQATGKLPITTGAPQIPQSAPPIISTTNAVRGASGGEVVNKNGERHATQGPDNKTIKVGGGEYILPRKTVLAMGGPEALDQLVRATTGNEPGPVVDGSHLRAASGAWITPEGLKSPDWEPPRPPSTRAGIAEAAANDRMRNQAAAGITPEKLEKAAQFKGTAPAPASSLRGGFEGYPGTISKTEAVSHMARGSPVAEAAKPAWYKPSTIPAKIATGVGRIAGSVAAPAYLASSAQETWSTPTEVYEERFGFKPNTSEGVAGFARDVGVRALGALSDLANPGGIFWKSGRQTAPAPAAPKTSWAEGDRIDRGEDTPVVAPANALRAEPERAPFGAADARAAFANIRAMRDMDAPARTTGGAPWSGDNLHLAPADIERNARVTGVAEDMWRRNMTGNQRVSLRGQDLQAGSAARHDAVLMRGQDVTSADNARRDALTSRHYDNEATAAQLRAQGDIARIQNDNFWKQAEQFNKDREFAASQRSGQRDAALKEREYLGKQLDGFFTNAEGKVEKQKVARATELIFNDRHMADLAKQGIDAQRVLAENPALLQKMIVAANDHMSRDANNEGFWNWAKNQFTGQSRKRVSALHEDVPLAGTAEQGMLGVQVKTGAGTQYGRHYSNPNGRFTMPIAGVEEAIDRDLKRTR